MKTKTTTINNLNKNCHFGIACLVCGESVPLTTDEEYAIRSGFHVNPKICDKCKEAILYVRKTIENNTERKEE